MATSKPSNGQLPPGFVPPFNRVEMTGSHDDLLACAAILCGKPLDEVKKIAVALGMPAHGPFYVDEVLFRRILLNANSTLTASDYKDFTSLPALPDVAVLCVDHGLNDACRHVVWHHVRATAQQASFSYIIDPANWIDPKLHTTTDLAHLSMKPAWFIEISQLASATKPPSK